VTEQSTRTAAIVVIGDEILAGRTADSNTPFLLSELRELGVDVRRILVVPDVIEDIVEAIRSTQPRHDLVFTSGGIGPTHDDVTMAAIARAMGRPLVRHARLVQLIEDLYEALGKKASEVHLRMAEVPEGTELVEAEGLRIPLLVLENIYILPGIPELFREKFLAIRERFRSAPFHVVRLFCKRGEGHLAPLMSHLVEEHPGLRVGSYPVLDDPGYRVQVILESKDRALLERACEALRARIGEEAIVRVERR
jgi:molybdenum cofactor synthesis domain-containing protein